MVACGDDEKSSSRAATAVAGDAFCTEATKVDELTDAMGAALMSGDPVQFESGLDALINAAESAEKVAPTDIVQQINTSIDGFKQLRAGLEKFNWDFDAAAADPEFAALMENEDLETNGTEIDEYLAEKCGIEAS